jgi:hypothetical protein
MNTEYQLANKISTVIKPASGSDRLDWLFLCLNKLNE